MSKRIHNENEIVNKIKDTLEKSKVSMTQLELRQVIPKVDRTLLRKLVRKGELKKNSNYAHNSTKTFMNTETKQIETVKGTHFYRYGLGVDEYGC